MTGNNAPTISKAIGDGGNRGRAIGDVLPGNRGRSSDYKFLVFCVSL